MYPALSSVHTNTLNFVHILIQAFFVRHFSSQFFLYLSFAFFALLPHAPLSFTSIVIKTKKVDFVSY